MGLIPFLSPISIVQQRSAKMKCKGDLREFLITGRKLPSDAQPNPPLTPLMPSPKLTEIWVPDTEHDQDPSKSSVSKLSLPRTAEDPTFNSSTTARSDSHSQERSCPERHKTLQDSPLYDQTPWTSEESVEP